MVIGRLCATPGAARNHLRQCVAVIPRLRSAGKSATDACRPAVGAREPIPPSFHRDWRASFRTGSGLIKQDSVHDI